MISRIVTILASASLVGPALSGLTATRAADVLPVASSQVFAEGGGGSDACRVDVVRTGQSGVAKITRSLLANGRCVCTVTTGPKDGNGSAEGIVADLLSDRTCDGAPPPADTAAGQAAATGGGSGGMIGGLVGALAVGGLAAGLGGKSKG